MNFRKGSKRPNPSEWSLSLEIMCWHFILSCHHTFSHICNHICHKKCNITFQKWGGGVKGRLEFFQKFIRFGSGILPFKQISSLTRPNTKSNMTKYEINHDQILRRIRLVIGGNFRREKLFCGVSWQHQEGEYRAICLLLTAINRKSNPRLEPPYLRLWLPNLQIFQSL